MFATRSWPAGSSTCPSAAGSSSASTTATRCARGTSRGARWRSAPGSGRTCGYEKLNGQEYYAVELLQELAGSIEARFPGVTTIVGDCQTRLPFDDAYFDRVLAIHVLEHLPTSRRRSRRSHACSRPTLASSPSFPAKGAGSTVLARRFTSKRLFEREFGRDYDWFIRSEHINLPWEIRSELEKRFHVVEARYFPFRVPSVSANLIIGLTMRPRT